MYMDIINSETGYGDYGVIIPHKADDLLGASKRGGGWGAREIPKNDYWLIRN
jgi:hypothetical protein